MDKLNSVPDYNFELLFPMTEILCDFMSDREISVCPIHQRFSYCWKHIQSQNKTLPNIQRKTTDKKVGPQVKSDSCSGHTKASWGQVLCHKQIFPSWSNVLLAHLCSKHMSNIWYYKSFIKAQPIIIANLFVCEDLCILPKAAHA